MDKEDLSINEVALVNHCIIPFDITQVYQELNSGGGYQSIVPTLKIPTKTSPDFEVIKMENLTHVKACRSMFITTTF